MSDKNMLTFSSQRSLIVDRLPIVKIVFYLLIK